MLTPEVGKTVFDSIAKLSCVCPPLPAGEM
jgi:hypothetical protein